LTKKSRHESERDQFDRSLFHRRSRRKIVIGLQLRGPNLHVDAFLEAKFRPFFYRWAFGLEREFIQFRIIFSKM
jgi:hypothetical protein